MYSVNVVVSGLPGGVPVLCLQVGDVCHGLVAADVMGAIECATGLPCASFFIQNQGRLACGDAVVSMPGETAAFVNFSPRRALPGGKGGFGAMLRGTTGTKKTTNFDACRDLSGRRLRDVNNERRVQEFVAEQQRLRLADSERDAVVPPVVPGVAGGEIADDDEGAPAVDTEELNEAMDETGRSVADAVLEGMRAARSSRRKRARAVSVAGHASIDHSSGGDDCAPGPKKIHLAQNGSADVANGGLSSDLVASDAISLLGKRKSPRDPQSPLKYPKRNSLDGSSTTPLPEVSVGSVTGSTAAKSS